MKVYFVILFLILVSCSSIDYQQYTQFKKILQDFYNSNKEVISEKPEKAISMNRFNDIDSINNAIKIWEKNRETFLSIDFIDANILTNREILVLIQFDNVYFCKQKFDQSIFFYLNTFIKENLLKYVFNTYNEEEMKTVYQKYIINSESHTKNEMLLLASFFDEVNELLLLWENN